MENDILKIIPTTTGQVLVLNHKVGQGGVSKMAIIEAIDHYEANHKSCPKCKKVGLIEKDFGFRDVSGKKKEKIIPQRWCRICRTGK